MKYISQKAATETLQSLFSHTREDKITLDEAFRAWGRESYSLEKNKHWFDNKMTHLKYHSLIKPVYERRNARRVLFGIQLTLLGKRALGRIEGDNKNTESSSVNNISLGQITKLVSLFKKQNSEYDVVFEVKLKSTSG